LINGIKVAKPKISIKPFKIDVITIKIKFNLNFLLRCLLKNKINSNSLFPFKRAFNFNL
jgi:hypothetical protein